MSPVNNDYEAMTTKMADELKGISLLPWDIRNNALQKWVERDGANVVVEAFAHFIGMANSVVENNREMIEMLGIIKGGEHPYTAEKYNLPTIFGALQGVSLAAGIDQAKTCGGCAYRLGTCANQSPSTTSDADWSNSGGGDFLCHERLDDKGEPQTRCIGYALRQKQNAKAA